jgi:hypothetical protein
LVAWKRVREGQLEQRWSGNHMKKGIFCLEKRIMLTEKIVFRFKKAYHEGAVVDSFYFILGVSIWCKKKKIIAVHILFFKKEEFYFSCIIKQ